MNWLSGYKSYIAAGLLALVAFAQAMSWINEAQATMILAAAGALGIVGIRHAISKATPPD